MRPAQLLAQLDDEQRAAVLAPGGPLLISAGAGTGKTRTVATRIAYRVATGQVPASAVLAVTHTNRAAGELRDRLDSFAVNGLEDVTVRTFHGAARGQLDYLANSAGMPPWEVLADAAQTVRDICRSLRILPEHVSAVHREIDWAKCSLISPARYVELAGARHLPKGLARQGVVDAYERYELALRRRGVADTTDLLLLAAHQLENDPVLADVVRARARFIVVDEFQDTDAAQFRLLSAWTGSPGADVTVVGDLRQAIYTWKGSDPALLATFGQRSDVTVTRLATNYRSNRAVVEVANRLSADPGLLGDIENSSLTDTALRTSASEQRPGSVTAHVALDETDELRWLTRAVEHTLRGSVAPDDVAVLVRTQAQARLVSEHLTGAGIPATCPPSAGFFARPEVVAACSHLAAELDDPHGNLDGLSGPSALRQVLADAGFDRHRPPATTSATWDIWAGRAGLLDWVEAQPSAELLGAQDLLDLLRERARAGHWARARAVNVMTVHAAKGLEFDVVFCPGWDSHSSVQTPEERRLAYVAATRARQSLHVSGARQRGGAPRVPTDSLVTSGLLVARS